MLRTTKDAKSGFNMSTRKAESVKSSANGYEPLSLTEAPPLWHSVYSNTVGALASSCRRMSLSG